MLNFKEYTIMSFQNLFEERFKNHFLKQARRNLFKFNLNPDFLATLTDNGNNSEAIKYFVNLIETEEPYTSLFNSFLTDSKNKEYYRFACYYLKQAGVPKGIEPLKKDLPKQQNASLALKEIFANELYKHLSILSVSKPSDKQQNTLAETKKQIAKSFVPDAISYNITPAITDFLRFGTLTNDQSYIGGFDNLPLEQKSSYYNDRTILFQNRIFNEEAIEKRIKLIDDGVVKGVIGTSSTNDLQKFLLETTKNANHSELLDSGAYVEYYFKFNYDLLSKFEGFSIPDQTELTYYERKGLKNHNYYSFREATLLLLFLKIIYTGYTLQSSIKTLSKTDILDNLDLKFGARLVVRAPSLDNFTPNKIKFGDTNKTYATQEASDVDSHKSGVNREALNSDIEKYSKDNIKSAYNNKTFVYNLIEQTFGSTLFSNKDATHAASEFFKVEQYETFPLAEYEISLPTEEVQGSTVPVILAKLESPIVDISSWRNAYDYLVDQEIIAPYSQQVLDGLFNSQIVKDYFASKTNSTNGVVTATVDNQSSYDAATQGTILNGSKTELLDNFISEANKMDDIIDQNLITLVDSIEVS